MKSIVICILLIGLFPTIASAHLCNDIFAQAQDNLAVKVDIRDGQLRIGKQATFRVYLLNTMDQAIEDIRLEVLTQDFDAKVTPSPEWDRFPILRVQKKQYFEVDLTRKSHTESGKYTIALRLVCNNKDLKTVNIDDALSVMKVPEKSSPPRVDGNISSAEWKDSVLCTSFYEYKHSGLLRRGYLENVPSKVQTRVRFSRYKNTLYGLIDFMKPTGKDLARIYVAGDHESTPTVIVADLKNTKAFVEGKKSITINTAVNGTKMELELPFDVLQITNRESFYVNVTRDVGKVTTYWRGNSYSVMDPIVYAHFIF